MFDALVADDMGPVIVRYLADLDATSPQLAAPEGALEAEARVSATTKCLRHDLLEVETQKCDPDCV